MQPTFSEIRYETANGIATVTLNRPDKLNAWTQVMHAEVHQAMTRAGQDDEIRCIIITGAGRGFCAGADMNLLKGLQNDNQDADRPDVGGAIEGGLELAAGFSNRYTYFPTVPKPVIAAVNGAAAGLGMVIALFADMRFVADSAKFVTAFSRRGLIAEHGISWALPRLVGQSRALDLLYSARPVAADEAMRIGLADRVFPADQLLAETQKYARDLVENVSPRSLRVMKQQLHHTPFQSLEDAVIEANREMELSFKSDDFREGVAHFLEKRPARFTGN